MEPKYIAYEEPKFYLQKRYRLKKVIGQGSYGTVCSAIDTKSSEANHERVQLAIKKVSRIFDNDVLLKRAVRELKLMRHFKGHRNIINLVDLELIQTAPYDGLYCFQELIDFDLSRVIRSDTQFSEFHIKDFFYQILCGVKYIHSADVIHRDLKPGNILVTVLGTLKICDFGLARGIVRSSQLKSSPVTNYVATRYYRAPELMLSRALYGKAVDIWAVGCILAELYGRRPIFMGKDQLGQLNEIIKVLGAPDHSIVSKYNWRFFASPRPQYKKVQWDTIYPFASGQALHILDNVLCWDPYERMTIDELLMHPFVKEVRDPLAEASTTIFDFLFESAATKREDLVSLILNEVEHFKQQRSK